jgi:membrane protein required for colicin V production
MLISVDWVLLGVLGLSALLGALRGFVAEVLSIVVWVAAFWLAFQYGANAAEALQPQVPDPAGRLLAAYALVFVLAVVVGSVVTWMAGRLVRSMGLGGVDRFFGLVYGTMRGVLLGCLLVLLLGFTALPREPEWNDSPLIPEYQRGAEQIREWMPESAAKHVNFDAVVEKGKQQVVQAVTKQVLEGSLPADAASSAAPSEDSSPQDVPLQPRPKRHRRN